jgi:phosphatidylglycerol:prolipoprotein diacylglycerol transferase
VTFPLYVPLGPWQLHPHWVFETLAYSMGFRLYLRQRRRSGDVIDGGTRWSIVAAAAAGGAIGSRLLFWLEDPPVTLAHWNDIAFLLGGKTIIGGLLGALISVELVKRRLGIRRRTGDLFALPIACGIAIGRIGCFLSGLPDGTFGTPTSMPWGVDFGDGIARHPTQLYEAVGLSALVVVLARVGRRPHREGDLFKVFMVAYLGLRLLLDALKPEVRVALGLSSLQWAALATLFYYGDDIRRWLSSGVSLAPVET